MLFTTSHLSDDNFIDGDKFEVLCESTGPSLLYLKTNEAVRRVEEGEPITDTPGTTLVTHNSDYHVTDKMAETAVGQGVSRWFAQNAETANPLVTPIPIGLERRRWFPHLEKRKVMVEGMSCQHVQPTRLCLSNFSLGTNFGPRKQCMDAGRSFCSVSVSPSVVQEAYPWYVREVLDHWFNLCPDGNGVDTHRLWETLYLGRIPVVTSSVLTESMRDLPILILSSWADLRPEVLQDYLQRFQAGGVQYSLDKLDFDYWANRILAI